MKLTKTIFSVASSVLLFSFAACSDMEDSYEQAIKSSAGSNYVDSTASSTSSTETTDSSSEGDSTETTDSDSESTDLAVSISDMSGWYQSEFNTSTGTATLTAGFGIAGRWFGSSSPLDTSTYKSITVNLGENSFSNNVSYAYVTVTYVDGTEVNSKDDGVTASGSYFDSSSTSAQSLTINLDSSSNVKAVAVSFGGTSGGYLTITGMTAHTTAYSASE